MPLREAVARFEGCGAPWWIAGGHAIELAAGRVLREHGDIDVLLMRRDQLAVQKALAGWEWWAADPPGHLRPWAPGEVLPPGVHDVWCRPAPDRPWQVQVMLDETDGDDWVSRRCPQVRRPLAGLGAVSADGVPYLAPEVQLFYKAKVIRPKDELDLDSVLPVLDPTARTWLADALFTAYGPHPWADLLHPQGARS
ncbi:amino acid transporter [Streptomyces sp. NPDC029216]|uniref:nucleotidyltransferase domain-containing protein n=1 Tax=Streptomyces sp. NPDC029216 TaxID=3154701 RepID=UPI0033D31899